MAGFDCRTALRLAELRRDGDHGVLDRADLFVCRGQQFAEDVVGNVDGCVGLTVDRPVVIGVANEPLGILNHAIGADNGVSQGLGADEDVLPLFEEDDRGSGQFPLLVGQGDRFALLVEVGQAGVGGSQVNSDGVRVFRVHDLTTCLLSAHNSRWFGARFHATITARGPLEKADGGTAR